MGDVNVGVCCSGGSMRIEGGVVAKQTITVDGETRVTNEATAGPVEYDPDGAELQRRSEEQDQ